MDQVPHLDPRTAYLTAAMTLMPSMAPPPLPPPNRLSVQAAVADTTGSPRAMATVSFVAPGAPFG